MAGTIRQSYGSHSSHTACEGCTIVLIRLRGWREEQNGVGRVWEFTVRVEERVSYHMEQTPSSY